MTETAFLRFTNPDTEHDLIVPVEVTCNTDDETLKRNIRKNSEARGNWLTTSPAHDRPAILCGSGPSLIDTLPEIRALRDAGGAIFALNNAANVLFYHGIMPDYQVVVDARPKTVAIVGPAKQHLFASQVDPSLFDAVPDAILWQLSIEDTWDAMSQHLPPYDGDYALIGGTASAGNVATCLAYAMGFRALHCFGYDSSFRGAQSHAAEQPINADEALTRLRWNGRDYVISLTMKSQADTFMRHAIALQDGGATISVYGDGYLPDLWKWNKDTPVAERESAKYREMWSIPQYRVYSPGEDHLEAIERELDLSQGATILDLGCGTGRLTARLAERYQATGVDFAPNCRDPEAEHVPFIEANLWDLPADLTADYGVCCDVMEHIPPEMVDAVLSNIAKACRKSVFFRIEFTPDSMGALIGTPLHLSVQPEDWWSDALIRHFPSVRVIGNGVFVASH